MPSAAILLALITAVLVLVYIELAGNGWVYDDNFNFVLAQHFGLSLHWLNMTIFQHWGIAYRFVFSAISDLMPIDYRWALVGMLVLLGASMYLFERIVRMLFGGRWVSVLAATYMGLSILFIRPLQWASDGLQHLPNTFFDLLCLYAYLRFVVDQRVRWAALAAGALGVGLLFFEKPAYLLLYLPAVRVLFMSDTFQPRALARVFWEERIVWGPLLAVTGIWAIGYVSSGGAGGIAHGHVGLSDYLVFFRILWAQTLAPAAANLTVPNLGLDTGQVLLAGIIQVAVLALVVVSVLRKRSAWRAWAFVAICVAVTGVPVARSRIPQFGVGVGGDVRYIVDFTWLIPLSVVFAFVAQAHVWPRPGQISRRHGAPARRIVVLGATALAALYAIAGVISVRTLQDQWAGRSGRAWETNVGLTLARFPAGGRRAVVANAETPGFIVPEAFRPWNRFGYVVPLYRPGTQIDGPLDGPLLTIDATGVAHRATVATVLDRGLVSQLVRRRQLTVTGAATVSDSHRGVCVQAGAAPVELHETVPSSPRPAPRPYYLMAGAASRAPVDLPVYLDVGQGFSPAPAGVVHADVASSRSILFLGTVPPRRLALTVSPGSRLCLAQLDVVTLQAVS